MKLAPNLPCACHSGIKYKRCCRPIHRGRPAEGPDTLVRARFSGFAYGLAGFVMGTTDPSGPVFEADAEAWERSILSFSGGTLFTGLAILAVTHGAAEGRVTFRASLRQGGKDASFTEQSRFVRSGDAWLYHSGVLS